MGLAPGHASLRFYAELNDHLPAEERYRTLQRDFLTPRTVKDLIESCGVPHAEVDLILANGESVDFSYLVRDGDRIAVYPMFEALDVTPELRVRPKPLREPKFVLDVHLGKLAAYLRMLGFDCEYRNTFADAELVRISTTQHRILLTRDRGLLKRGAITRGYWLRHTESRRQVMEVVRRFDLVRAMRPFTKCMACNGILQAVEKELVRGRVPPRIWDQREEFQECTVCGRVYWKGSHYERMRRWIQEIASSPVTGIP